MVDVSEIVRKEMIDIDEVFWDQYPNFKAANPFKKLYTSDKSRNKQVSSVKMWCIALIYDRESPFYDLPEIGEDNKIDLIINDYGNPEWFKKNRAEFDELSRMYQKMQETKPMKSLRELEEKLEERDMFLKNTKYTMGMPNDKGQLVGGTADTLEKMFANTLKILETVEKTRALVNNEKDTSTKGDINESLSDKAEI